MANSRVERGLTAPSAVLGHDVGLAVYLPPGYGTPHDRRYPVVYLLHGTQGGGEDWLDAGGLQAIADQLILDREIPPLIIVTPDAGNSWYVDNLDDGGTGPWATAFIDDLIPWVDRRYHTIAKREGRGIAGLSMGGYGALRFALTRPDLFAAVASLSGAIFLPNQNLTADDIADLYGAFGDPFDRQRFEAENLFQLVPRLSRAEQRPEIYIASGDRDDFDLEENALYFYLALKRAGIRASLRIREGGHNWQYWASELPPALRFLGGVLAAATPPQPVN